MIRISSRDNERFRRLRKLWESGRERRKSGLIVLDGMHLVESYTQHFSSPLEILVSESGLKREEISRFLDRPDVIGSVCALSDALFAEMSPVDTPSGIAAVATRPENNRMPDLQADAVVLDGIQDPGNLGSILRSAAAAGFAQVLLSTDCAQAWSPKTLRAAMGAHFGIAIFEHCDLTVFLDGFGGQIIATSLGQPSENLFALDLARPLAWVFGSEGLGVRPEVAQRANVCCRIPMPGGVESLNVGAAAAVCLFETVRQRMHS